MKLDMINIKNLDPNNIKTDKKPYKSILIYYTGYVALNSVKALHLIIINQRKRYTEQHNGHLIFDTGSY